MTATKIPTAFWENHRWQEVSTISIVDHKGPDWVARMVRNLGEDGRHGDVYAVALFVVQTAPYFGSVSSVAKEIARLQPSYDYRIWCDAERDLLVFARADADGKFPGEIGPKPDGWTFLGGHGA